MEKETKISITFRKNKNSVDIISDKTDMELTGIAAKHFVYELVDIYEEYHNCIKDESTTLVLMASLVNFKTLIVEKIDTLGRKMGESLDKGTRIIIDEMLKMEMQDEGPTENEMRGIIGRLVPSETDEYKENLYQLWVNDHAMVTFKPILH